MNEKDLNELKIFISNFEKDKKVKVSKVSNDLVNKIKFFFFIFYFLQKNFFDKPHHKSKNSEYSDRFLENSIVNYNDEKSKKNKNLPFDKSKYSKYKSMLKEVLEKKK